MLREESGGAPLERVIHPFTLPWTSIHQCFSHNTPSNTPSHTHDTPSPTLNPTGVHTHIPPHIRNTLSHPLTPTHNHTHRCTLTPTSKYTHTYTHMHIHFLRVWSRRQGINGSIAEWSGEGSGNEKIGLAMWPWAADTSPHWGLSFLTWSIRNVDHMVPILLSAPVEARRESPIFLSHCYCYCYWGLLKNQRCWND